MGVEWQDMNVVEDSGVWVMFAFILLSQRHERKGSSSTVPEWKPPWSGHGASLLREWQKGSLSMQLEEQCEQAEFWRELWFLLFLAPKVSLA